MLLIVAVVVAVVVMFLPTNLFLQEAGDGTFFTFQSTIHLQFFNVIFCTCSFPDYLVLKCL